MLLCRCLGLSALILATCSGLSAANLKVVPFPEGQDLVRENGMIAIPAGTRNKVLDLTPTGGFAEGHEYTFQIRYANCRFVFVTGRSYYPVRSARLGGGLETNLAPEMVTFTPLADSRSKVFYGLQGVEASPRILDWRDQSSTIALNYIMPPQTFATIDNVARWQEKEAEALRNDLAKADIRLGVAVTKKQIRILVNGVLLRQLPRADIDPAACVLRIQRDTVIADTAEVVELSPRFLALDISERLNASGLPGIGMATNLPAGGEVVVGGVPFRLPPKQSKDHVDLSMSWMEAAMRCGYSETEVWTRWRAATEKVPLRYQFRVPVDAYDHLYVLAASDTRPDTIPRFTAQFYLPRRGRPVNFTSPDVPAFQAEAEVADSLTVLSANGKQARLYLVRVPLEPGQFTKFSRSDFVDMELTKEVQTFRAYPDPLTHSTHGAGLPSSVRVFGITFERSAIETTLTPGNFANIWHEGERVSYQVALKNNRGSTAQTRLAFKAVSYDGEDVFQDSKRVRLPAGDERQVTFAFRPKKFGHYTVTLVREADGEVQTFNRTLAHLRQREYGARPFDHKGMFFGCWSVGSVDTVRLAGMMGMDGFSGLNPANDEARALIKYYGMQDFNGTQIMRIGNSLAGNRNEAEDLKILREKMPPLIIAPDDFRKPTYAAILCEPGGIGTGHAGFGEYFGEAPYDYSKLDSKYADRYAHYKYQFLTIRKAFRELTQDMKVMLPNGSWCFTIPFLQDPDTRKLMDGVKCDFQFYTRLPEQQMHQCSIHSMYYFQQAWKKYRPGETPLLAFGEGPDVSPVYPGGSTEEVAAAHRIRCSVIMAGYGAHHQHAWATSINQAGGENHCTGGFLDNEVSLNPELAYSAFATHTRHTRDAQFESYTNPGSFSAYCANFRNHKSGQLMRIIWSIRGEREFIFDAPARQLTVFDTLDNIIRVKERDGHAVISVGAMPLYVYGADENVAVHLGAVDHSDAKFGKLTKKIGNLADLVVAQTEDADAPYVEMMPEYIRRFQTTMEIGTNEVDATYGGRALSVSLPPQQVDRGLMPYFTCLKLAKPLPIDGKASHILVWTKGASDWGRIVYVLRDAKGKSWYSVGLKGQWNADDMPGDSIFCFDGWRLLRYELPANAPWDAFRELGFTNWGSEDEYSQVELPLALEKIFVERRSSVMYGNSQQVISEEQPVLLSDLYVEYARESDQTAEVVRLSKIRAPQMPASDLPNPIAELKKTGTLPAGRITKVDDPDTWFDGTRGVFTFEMPTNAVSADIWLSLESSGRGALKQGSGLKQSPSQVSGFLAGTEFHAFLIYTDREGQTSTPSEPFKFRLVDHFSHQ